MNAQTLHEALIAAGFEHGPDVIEPGRMYRFPGIGKRRGNKAGWCKLFDDGRGAVFGDWASGFTATWQAERQDSMTPAERARFKREIAKARRERDQEDRQKWQQAAIEARRQWAAAIPETGAHRYLIAKQVQAHGIRSNGFQLLIPVHSIDGDLQSLQIINPAGSKCFLPGGRITGGMFTIGEIDPAGTILICEGYATGATLHEDSGHPVVVAFNAGNLKPVSIAMRRKYPQADLVICGDNDRQTPGNPGETKAREAAIATGARLAIPQFDDDEPGTDWNDWHLNRQGKQEVTA